MAASALDAAPVVEREPRFPGGGGPVDDDPHGWGGGGGDGDDAGKRRVLYRLGTLLAVAAVTSLFVALVLIFWFRSRSAFLWQPVDVPHALWASTGVLAISSWMLELSRDALRQRRWFAYRRRLLLTVYLGLGFIACQVAALYRLVHEGMFLSGNPHAAVFYVFTGAHALHLACGMAGLNYLLFVRRKNWSQHLALAESAAIYWHFLGVLWVALFILLLSW